MELLHPAMWHNRNIDFARWQHPAMWNVALESQQWIHQVAAPCNVIIRGSGMTCRWTRTAPCNVTYSSGIHQVAAPCNVARGSGMTCHGIHPNVHRIGILHLVSILTNHRSRHVILHQSTKFYPNRTTLSRKQWRHVDFQDGGSQPSWILGSSNGFFEKPMVNRDHSSKFVTFRENRVFALWRQDPRWQITAMFDFLGPIMGSLKSPCTTFYRSSIETIALNCLVFEKITFFVFWCQHPRWRISAILDFKGPLVGSLKSPCTTSHRSLMETITLNLLLFGKIVLGNHISLCPRHVCHDAVAMATAVT